MSTFLKIALIISIGAVVLGARYLGPPAHTTGEPPAQSISPMELMRSTGALPHTPVDNHM